VRYEIKEDYTETVRFFQSTAFSKGSNVTDTMQACNQPVSIFFTFFPPDTGTLLRYVLLKDS